MSKLDRPHSDESRAAVFALLDRGPKRAELAREMFRRKYPNATEQMISAAVFHLYVDGIEAAVGWLADLEHFLANPDHELSFGTSSHLLYHVYNWHVLESLMPHGKTGMHELVDEIIEFADGRDIESVRRAASELKALLDGKGDPPDVA